MYELPPILTGTEQDQLRAIRDYLVRLAQSMDQGGAGTDSAEVEQLRQYGQSLQLKIERNDRKLKEQAETIRKQEQALTALQTYAETLQGWLPADGTGAALGKTKTLNATLELGNGWTLTLNGPNGTPSVSLSAAQLRDLLALLN